MYSGDPDDVAPDAVQSPLETLPVSATSRILPSRYAGAIAPAISATSESRPIQHFTDEAPPAEAQGSPGAGAVNS